MPGGGGRFPDDAVSKGVARGALQGAPTTRGSFLDQRVEACAPPGEKERSKRGNGHPGGNEDSGSRFARREEHCRSSIPPEGPGRDCPQARRTPRRACDLRRERRARHRESELDACGAHGRPRHGEQLPDSDADEAAADRRPDDDLRRADAAASSAWKQAGRQAGSAKGGGVAEAARLT